MKAIARRVKADGYTHEVEVGRHAVTVDEPREDGGDDQGPNPQELLAVSLASCTAITVEMYAQRKGWDVGQSEVECRYEQPAHRGEATRFELILRLPDSLDDEQRERLLVIAGKCPVHRTLAGDVSFDERIEPLGEGQSAT
jgi:putative redox protein